MADSPDRIISIDYTDLFRHRSRSFNFDEFAIRPGIDWQGFGWGVGAAILTGGVSGIVAAVFTTSTWAAVGIGFLIATPIAVIVYQLIARDSRGRLSPLERLFLWIDFTFRQPHTLRGTRAADAATELHWQAMLWRPGWSDPVDGEFRPPVAYGIHQGR